VGALCARSAALGAFLNVRTNAKDLADRGAAGEYLARGRALEEQAVAGEREVLELVERKLGS
jgi:glutamate formiminotransferase/formiminotetrahydrofolate cyclodeaminase